jgi:acetyl esterase
MKTMETLDFLEQKTKSFIEELNEQGGKPLYQLSPAEARKILEDLQSQTHVEKPAVQFEDVKIPGGPKGDISVRIFRPTHSTDKLSPIVYFHGGGWILGSKNTHDRLMKDLSFGANAAVFFVNYSPSPEAKYPIPLEEAYAATRFIADNRDKFNLAKGPFVIAGDSVGGNMVAAVTLLAKERGGPKIDYQVLFYPVTDAAMNTKSYEQFADGPWLTKAAMKWFWDAYAPNAEDRKKITVSPLRASLEQLSGLPAALIITDENDVLRDEGEAYAHKLMQAGVEVTSIRFLGTIHDFVMLNALTKTPASRSAIALVCEKLQKVFSQRKK